MNEESKNSDNDFEHSCDVFEREDYKTAYKLFLSLANKGIDRKSTRNGKKLETEEMKTKQLTFLLSLTFLFLFSGSVFGQEEEV